ncbi:MAG: hypothetical protein ABR907_10245 [Terracidiphilus sp.]|jgi:hypothetical protein
MRLYSCLFSATFVAGLGLLASPAAVFAEESASKLTVAEPLPEAPQAQYEVASSSPQEAQAPQTQSPAAQSQPAAQPAISTTPARSDAAKESTSSQSPAQQTDAEKSKHEKAEEQIKEQEKQRLVGVLPQFNISYRPDAVSMTAGQKIKLALRSTTDPVAFGVAAAVAGYHELDHDNIGFPWGVKGYGERWGAAYLDAFDGNMIGNGFLPALLHQDPRYFRLGHGTVTHRLLYSLATNVMCKHDNTRKWEPNYSNIGGNILAGAISNLYYPATNSGVGQTFTNGFIVTAEGGFGSVFDEFWPDISRKVLHKDPTRGLDAQMRAADKAKKDAGKEAEKDAAADKK